MRNKLCLFSEKLNECLKQNNISQQKLADMLGTTQQTVSRWIKEINEPDFDTLLYICYEFGISPDELLGWNDIKEYNTPYSTLYEQMYADKYKAVKFIENAKMKGAKVSFKTAMYNIKKKQ